MLQKVQRFANNIWRSKIRLLVIEFFVSILMGGVAVGLLMCAPLIQNIVSDGKAVDWIVNNCLKDISCKLKHIGRSANCLVETACEFEHVICVSHQQFILTAIFIYGITIFSAFLAFVLLRRILAIKPFKISKQSGFISDFKFVTTWVIIYGVCNTIIQILGLPSGLSYYLSISSPSIVFITMLRTGAYGYKISQDIIPRKK